MADPIKKVREISVTLYTVILGTVSMLFGAIMGILFYKKDKGE